MGLLEHIGRCFKPLRILLVVSPVALPALAHGQTNCPPTWPSPAPAWSMPGPPPPAPAPVPPATPAPFPNTTPAIDAIWSYETFGRSLFSERPLLLHAGVFQDFECGTIAVLEKWPGDAASTAPVILTARRDTNSSLEFQWDGAVYYDFFDLLWGPDQNELFPFAHRGSSGPRGLITFPVAGPNTFGFRIRGCQPIACPGVLSPPVWTEVGSYLWPPHEAFFPPSVQAPPLVPIFTPGELLTHEPDDGGRWTPAQKRTLRDHFCNNTSIALLHHGEDNDHAGEFHGLRALAMLQTVSEENASFIGCGGMERDKIKETVNQALRDAVVVSQPGTDISALVRWLAVIVPALIAAAVAAYFWGPVAVIGTFLVTLILSLFSLDPRPGDYDMNLTGLMQVAYRFEPQLDTPTRCEILSDLLTVHGEADELDEYLDLNILPMPIRETENHILMIQSARYLSNNLFLRWKNECPKVEQPDDLDNETNGMREWWLERLQALLIRDFYEFSSRPYSDHSLQAIRNLYDFAKPESAQCFYSKGSPPADPVTRSRCDVRRAARNVLDYVAARYAVSSNNFRRAAPFRRQPGQRNYSRLLGRESDRPSHIHFAYTADSPIVRMHGSRLNESMTATLLSITQSNYEPPYLITDLMSDLTKAPYTQSPTGQAEWLQRFRVTERDTSTPEIYYRDMNFLISAGGDYDSGAGWASLAETEDAWPLPTTLMPTAEGVDYRQLVRIQGSWEQDSRTNLCVTRGFACGLNPIVPRGIPAQCVVVDGDWIFIDMDANSAGCTLDYGFYVAVLRKSCGSDPCDGDDAPDNDEDQEDYKEQGDPKASSTFGFFEATTYSRPFTSYIAEVKLKNNSDDFKWGQQNIYRSPNGREITFELSDMDDHIYPIVSVSEPGRPVLNIERDTERWPLAAADDTSNGGMVRSYEKYPGCITVDNMRMNQRLILDLSNVKEPKRARVYLPSECNCPVRTECQPLRLE